VAKSVVELTLGQSAEDPPDVARKATSAAVPWCATPARKKPPQPMASPELNIMANFMVQEEHFGDGYDTEAEVPADYNLDAKEPVFEAPVEANSDIPISGVQHRVAMAPSPLLLLDIAKCCLQFQSSNMSSKSGLCNTLAT
jgi:hypothetical protein